MCFVCTAKEVVNLTANETFVGKSCPSGVEFNCTAKQIFLLNWYLDDKVLVSHRFSNSSSTNINLCERNNNQPVDGDFAEFCNNGGSLLVNSSAKENGVHNVTSRLVTTGTYISAFSNVSCGGCDQVQNKDLTNFTLSCYPENSTLTSNISNGEEGACSGIVNFTCSGTNVRFFQWTYNDNPLTQYINISNLNVSLNSSLSDINCSINQFNTNSTFAQNFNFESECIGNLSTIANTHVSSIGCNSSADDSQILLMCKFIEIQILSFVLYNRANNYIMFAERKMLGYFLYMQEIIIGDSYK